MEEVLKGMNKVIIDGNRPATASCPTCRCRRSQQDSRSRRQPGRRQRAAERRKERRNEPLIVAGVVAVVVVVLCCCSRSIHRAPDPAGAGAAVRQPGPHVQEPGLHVKVPFIQQVEYFDKRVLDFDAPSVELVLGDQKRLVVDTFARYRIADPLAFRQSVGSEQAFRGRLEPIVFSSLRSVLGEALAVHGPLARPHQADEPDQDEANKSLAQFGVELVDVRIKRADLPPENSQAIFQRMQTEREREAKELRAQGAEVGQRIRARADRERRVLIAEAQSGTADPARPGRRRGDPDLRRRVRAESRVLRLLPLAAGLSRTRWRRLDQPRAVAGQRVLPLLQSARPVAPAQAPARTRRRGLRPAAPAPPPGPAAAGLAAAPRRPRSGRAVRLGLGRMRDLGTALALVLVVEGVLWALFPERMKQAAARAAMLDSGPAAPGRARLRRSWASCWSG